MKLKAALLLLLIFTAHVSAEYDPTQTIEPENLHENIIDSLVYGFHNAEPYMIAITFVGLIGIAFLGVAIVIFVLSRYNAGGNLL